MRKGIIANLVLGLAVSVAGVTAANAQGLGGAVTQEQPAQALIMPFDVTDGRASFQLVSRIGSGGTDVVPVIATHWSFWSESCDHLADVFICLTFRDTVVVDPTALQGQVQSGQKNIPTGPIINLTGDKGFVTVTGFIADSNSDTCDVADPSSDVADASLIGSWVVANTSTNAAFGNNAIGLLEANVLPTAATFFGDDSGAFGGLFLQTFNPLSLQDSEVFFIGLSESAGNATFHDFEVGPIPANLPDGNAVCCNAQYYDNLESFVSLPDICLTCSTTAKIAENTPLKDIKLPAIIPVSIPAETAGFVRLTNCQIGDPIAAVPTFLGDDTNLDPTFLFAWHGMAVGPFGTSALGRYTTE